MRFFKKKRSPNKADSPAENKEFIRIETKPLLDWNEPNGEGCIVSDRITKDGWKVGYLYRDEPLADHPDSGWHFFCGDEDEDYSSNPDNFHVFALNTLCNYDPDVLPYLHGPIGTHWIRVEGGAFIPDDGETAICLEKQDR